MHIARRRLTLPACAAALAVAAGLGMASSAQAAQVPASQAICPAVPVSQPFAPWGDPASYELTPGGDFESSAWMLQGGAQRVPGSEPYAATGSLGVWALSLPVGAEAISPLICLQGDDRSLRFFIAGAGSVLVQVVDDGVTIPLGIAAARGSWQPGPTIGTGSEILAPISGGAAHVSLRLTALSGQPRVDDVFLDPWSRG
jgi:hypothetical protein